MNILILCTGNSCRSQMARAFLQSFDKSIRVRSAGTDPEKSVSPMAVKVMAEIGIDISNEKPKSVSQYLNEAWEYVITVCDNARETCPYFPGEVKNQLHMGFDDPAAVRGTEDFIRQEFFRVRDEIKTVFYRFYSEEIRSLKNKQNI